MCAVLAAVKGNPMCQFTAEWIHMHALTEISTAVWLSGCHSNIYCYIVVLMQWCSSKMMASILSVFGFLEWHLLLESPSPFHCTQHTAVLDSWQVDAMKLGLWLELRNWRLSMSRLWHWPHFFPWVEIYNKTVVHDRQFFLTNS